MKKNWTEIKSELEREIDRIWRDEPIEIKASKRGLFPSGAGSHGMATGNLFFQIADTYAAGFGSAANGIDAVLADDSFTLEQCKRMFVALYGGLSEQLGGKSKNGAAWLNLPKVWTFYRDIVDAGDSVKSKAEYASLLWSWKNYLKRLNMWFSLTFTWEVIGNLRTSKQVSDYEQLLTLTKKVGPYMENAAISKV